MLDNNNQRSFFPHMCMYNYTIFHDIWVRKAVKSSCFSQRGLSYFSLSVFLINIRSHYRSITSGAAPEITYHVIKQQAMRQFAALENDWEISTSLLTMMSNKTLTFPHPSKWVKIIFGDLLNLECSNQVYFHNW